MITSCMFGSQLFSVHSQDLICTNKPLNETKPICRQAGMAPMQICIRWIQEGCLKALSIYLFVLALHAGVGLVDVQVLLVGERVEAVLPVIPSSSSPPPLEAAATCCHHGGAQRVPIDTFDGSFVSAED